MKTDRELAHDAAEGILKEEGGGTIDCDGVFWHHTLTCIRLAITVAKEFLALEADYNALVKIQQDISDAEQAAFDARLARTPIVRYSFDKEDISSFPPAPSVEPVKTNADHIREAEQELVLASQEFSQSFLATGSMSNGKWPEIRFWAAVQALNKLRNKS